MRSLVHTLAVAVFCLAIQLAPASAQDADLTDVVSALAEGKFKERQVAIEAAAATGDPRMVVVLQALAEGNLRVRKSDGLVFIVRSAKEVDDLEKGFALYDPLTGERVGEAGKRAVKKIKVNNKLRRALRSAIGGLTLMSPDPQVRLDAAIAVFKARDTAMLPLLAEAIEAETDETIRRTMQEAQAVAVLSETGEEAALISAIGVLASKGDRDALSFILQAAEVHKDNPPVAEAALLAAETIEHNLAFWEVAQNIWYGLSLGSVLLLAAIGLAITFGVMGVINMAHGEMVMLGAYTTFVVQEIIRLHAPDLFNASLLFAVPLAFMVSGAAGVAIERGIIQWLYGRPLETLLATWGLSLVLQQTVRSIFGPTNQEVGNPDFMAGAFQLGQLTITYNRLWIIVFSFVVLAVLMVVMRRTSFGLQMRAVTQNRRMAGSMGIRSSWVDAMTFGLGSGIAGIAGVALSQIDNVSPNLGRGYIIDSFLVVVFGGVGNLWGTLVGAITLGVTNKFLEPFAGAVLGKILVLVFVILFIQKRPRGLFALKGRSVEQ